MKKNNLLIKLLTLLIIIAAVLPVFYMPAYAVEEEYGTQDISDHGISEQGENITSSESETSYVEEGNNVFDIVPKGYTLKAVQTRSVEFIIQYPPGQPTGNVTYELKKEINNREIVVKRGTLNKSQKKITFKDLELNTPYKFYLTKVPNGYGKPDGSVAEFYFDNDGIHFTKGESGIALTMTTAYVHFIVQNTSGLPVGGVVRYALNKVKGNQETQIKAGTADRATGKIILEKLEWNTPYKLYLRTVPKEYERPNDSVAEFYFDSEGINFIKGSTAVVLKKNNEQNNNGQDAPLEEGQYYGFTGEDSRIKISKEYNIATGTDAFCFGANKDFPNFGNKAVYNELSTSAETLFQLAENPRKKNPKELYDSVRKVIYYCEMHKKELLTDHQLGSDAFWFGSNDKEKGYYKALQEAIWYYSDSIDGLKSYSSGSVGYHIMKKAVKHIIQESEKVSDEDMECVKLKMYNSSMLGDHNSPLQPLIAFEIINKTDIKVQKVNKSGESLEGAAFRLEKLGDASFTPVEMGNESAISDFTFKCLDAGEYRLTEIKAPSNYIPLEEPILFTIIEESNGVFKIKLNTENSKVTLEEGTLTIKVANEKTVTTEITVDKKWFRADGTEFHPQDGEISYNLIQVLTTEGGESSEKIYKSGETLTSQDGWQKTYSNLPAADINGNGEKEICTYYVKEILIADYSTSYSNGSVGESEDPSAAALSSGTITVKNTEKMKFILPETGGTGRGILYIAGVFLLGISMILLGNKNSSFYECLHKKG